MCIPCGAAIVLIGNIPWGNLCCVHRYMHPCVHCYTVVMNKIIKSLSVHYRCRGFQNMSTNSLDTSPIERWALYFLSWNLSRLVTTMTNGLLRKWPGQKSLCSFCLVLWEHSPLEPSATMWEVWLPSRCHTVRKVGALDKGQQLPPSMWVTRPTHDSLHSSYSAPPAIGSPQLTPQTSYTRDKSSPLAVSEFLTHKSEHNKNSISHN